MPRNITLNAKVNLTYTLAEISYLVTDTRKIKVDLDDLIDYLLEFLTWEEKTKSLESEEFVYENVVTEYNISNYVDAKLVNDYAVAFIYHNKLNYKAFKIIKEELIKKIKKKLKNREEVKKEYERELISLESQIKFIRMKLKDEDSKSK